MPTDDASVVRPSVPYSVQAADIIRGRILSGTFELGERLNEVELAARLGISRSPLREGLRQLAEEGLVRIISGRGSFVASFEPNEVRDLLEVRMALDVFAAGLAAERATEHELAELESKLQNVTAALQHADQAQDPWAADFHLGVYQVCHNAKLFEQGRVIHTQLRFARFRSGAAQDRVDQAHKEHLQILQALRAHDGEAARKCMLHHLQQSRDHILDVVDHEPDARAT
jgi:GntR family transcriptional regulator, rspAB operon transcriptional repressor